MNRSSHFRNFDRARCAVLILCIVPFLSVGCQKAGKPQADNPRLTTNVSMLDVTFRSKALNKDVQYRAIYPEKITAGERLAVVYLLHGGGGGFRDWSNYSDVARYAERGLILIMPEGDSSYFVNSAGRPEDRYEDYIVVDLIVDVEKRFPVVAGRGNRAIAGVSMGGFGAVNLALRHPGLFVFAGGISPVLDVPSRPFSVRRIEQWRRFRAIFGEWNGQTQRENDPFVLAKVADPAKTPYLFLSCGEQEGLLSVNKAFVALLQKRHVQFEFHNAPGDHNWKQWDEQIPGLFRSMSKQMHLGD
ncbi:MAG: alpha/beta hydrolase family protein [Candidatus Acidiferrum sp.]